ncbi:MAG TPA: flagellar basal body-associated FliL family protein, partial [Ramlibacter sp.]|nr:flagellar basal body-associated FliL family protein [Ramlibacter sp.]
MPSAVAPTAAAAEDATPKKKGGKKLLLIAAVVLVLLAVAAVAAVIVLKQRQAAQEEAEYQEETTAAEAVAEIDTANPPVFLPLDPFTVNLADKNVERYAQIGITLEVQTPEMAEKMKAFMPAVRSNILLLLAHKTSEDLLDRAGKERLAAEIMREAVRPMGIELPEVESVAAEAS